MDFFNKIKDVMTGNGAQDQSDDEKKLASHVRSRLEDCRMRGSRIAWLGTVMTNIAYLKGFNSVYYDTSTRQFKNVYQNGRGVNRARLNANKILPRAQNRAAKLCKTPPKYDVRPESSQTDDKDAARLALDVLNVIWDKQRINQKRIELIMWAQQAGFSYIKTCWDPCLGNSIGPGEYEGDIRVEVVCPFEVFPDPLAANLEECQWLVHAKVRKLDYFRKHYPKGGLVKEEDAWILDLQYEQRINSLNKSGPLTSGSDLQMKNCAVEMIYYERPSKEFPEGRQVTTANGILLEDKELPIGEIPFAKFDDVVIAGSYISESVITHARPIQDQYIRLITKRAEWTNKLLAGKLLAARGHGMAPEAYDDTSGEVLEYNANPSAPRGGEPMYIQVPPMPQYAYEEETKLEAMIDEIFGLNELSQGHIPAGMPRAAAAMQILLEQDATRMGIITENHEHAFADVGRHILRFANKFYITTRLLKLAGNGLDYTVKSFKGADLKNNSDVYVKRGSTVPNSKVLERQEIMNIYQSGLMGDIQDPKVKQRVASMMEFGNIEEAWQDSAIDEHQVNRDLDMIKREMMPPVHELDNHQFHVFEKNNFRKSDKYESLSDKSKAILEGNLEEHLQWIIKLQNPGLQTQVKMSEGMAQQASQMTDQEAMAHQQAANAHMPQPGQPGQAPPPGPQQPMGGMH